MPVVTQRPCASGKARSDVSNATGIDVVSVDGQSTPPPNLYETYLYFRSIQTPIMTVGGVCELINRNDSCIYSARTCWVVGTHPAPVPRTDTSAPIRFGRPDAPVRRLKNALIPRHHLSSPSVPCFRCWCSCIVAAAGGDGGGFGAHFFC